MIHSHFQKEIYHEVQEEKSHILVSATAGSGKTETIKHASTLIPSRKKVLFLAFNKAIVEELRNKLPRTVEVATLHSMGRRFIFQPDLNNFKDFGLASSIATNRRFKKKRDYFSYVYTLCDYSQFARVNLKGPDDMKELAMKYSLDYTQTIETDFKDFWEKRKNIDDEIDFTDMLYMPVTKMLVKPKDQYDRIFVDECQDLNMAQITFLDMLLKPTGKLVAVGDQWQSIYGFAGADHESFFKLASRENTKQLPLSISYRCAKLLVENAQQINPEIQYYEKNPIGELRENDISGIQNNDLVICRNNLPLLDVYFKLVARGVKATIVGKEIEDGLKKLVKYYNTLSYEELQDRLEEDKGDLWEKLIDEGYDNPEKSKKYRTLVEKCRCIDAIISFAESNHLRLPILKLIEMVFVEQKTGVKLMSIHKSKGLESRRVFLIMTYEGKKLMPSTYAEQDWECQQEIHIEFVALTRAKLALYYLYL